MFHLALTDELTRRILREGDLSRRDLSRAALVNRQFLTFARQVLYQKITIQFRVYTAKSYATYIYDGKTWFLLRTLRSSPDLAQLVKTIKIKTYDSPVGVIHEERTVYPSNFFPETFKLLPNVKNLALDPHATLGQEARRYHHILKIKLSGLKISREEVDNSIGSSKSIVNAGTLVRFAGHSLPLHAPAPRLQVLDIVELPPRVLTSPRLRFLRTSLIQPNPSHFSSLSPIQNLTLFPGPSSATTSALIDFSRDTLPSLQTLSFESNVLESKTNLNLAHFLHSPPPPLRRVSFLHPTSLDGLLKFFRGETRFSLPDSNLKENGGSRFAVPELGVSHSFREDQTKSDDLEELRRICENQQIELYFVTERFEVFDL
ncbi:hypothetical protein JCM3765_004340 [Sporobolomyces pararoseus]